MKRITAVVILVLSSLALSGASPSQAGSGYCSDGVGPGMEVPIILAPITLAVQFSTGPVPYVQLCYATAPAGAGNTVTGGHVQVIARPSPTSTSGQVICGPDSNVVFAPTCNSSAGYTATPTYSVSGGLVSVSIPFSVCTGGCVTGSPTIASTGVIVGTLAPVSAPSGSTGAGYELTHVEVWLNGVRVHSTGGTAIAGIYADTGSPVYQNLHSSGPCVGGVCLPLSGVVKTTGSNPTVHLLLPGSSSTTPVTVPIPARCLYKNNDPTPCP